MIFDLTTRQSEAWHYLVNGTDVEMLYGGAKGGGKSFLFCLWVEYWVKKLIEFFKLQETKNPVPLGFIGRKQSVDFTHTTLETFKRIIPEDSYRIKTQEKEIIFMNRAKVFYGGLDDRQRIQKFNSAEFAFIGIDQAEETERVDLEVLRAALRLKINGLQPPYKTLFTANPADCHLKTDFIDNKLEGNIYVPALPTDNPHLPETYVNKLKNIFRHNQPMLRAYVDGDWFALKAANSLISNEMLYQLKGVTVYLPTVKRIIVCDPSLGGDECVINFMENGKLMEQKILVNERDTLKIGAEMIVMGERHRCDAYASDTTNMKGVMDYVRKLKPRARLFYLNFAEKASIPDRFWNKRAEMWWYAMEQIQEKRVAYPEDEETREQLTAVRFKPVDSNGKILLEPKADVKKRLGRSPDRADAWVMGIYALKNAPVVKNKDAWRENDGDSGEIASAVTSAMGA